MALRQQQQSQQPHAALQLDHAPDSGHKRAGSWLGTDIDLDCYRANKRYKVQEMAGDLARSMSLEGREGRSGRPAASGGSSGGAAAAPAVSTGSLPDSLMLCSAECSPVAAAGPDPRHHQHQQAQQQQAQRQQQQQQQPQQQRTPRSESRTPGGMQPAPCTGGGAGSGGLRPRPTPMRLYDALSLHPTSPSDPGLEGQLDLRKATLMRSLQTRLLRGEGGEASVSPPGQAAAVAAAAAAAPGDQQQRHRQQEVQQDLCDAQQQLLLQATSLSLAPADTSPPGPAASTLSSMLISQRSPTPHMHGPGGQRAPSPRLQSPLEDTGCSAMAVSPAAPPQARPRHLGAV